MIVYEIPTGKISSIDDDTGETLTLGTGYAGHGVWMNNPDAIDQHGEGPLPPGMYMIGTPEDRLQSTGEFSIPLTPDPTNEMWGRGDFYCHGDNPQQNHTASDGCIVCSRRVREIIAQHKVLCVIVPPATA
jgi:hypothetical protein